ncbi:MAG: hypothetical protein V8S42_09055 [Lachnospiraceae bacterium]
MIQFRSGLRHLFRAMNCRKDKEKMAELMKNEAYAHLSKETWEAIAVMTDNAAMLQKKDIYKNRKRGRGGIQYVPGIGRVNGRERKHG